jgi:hypothetical protein
MHVKMPLEMYGSRKCPATQDALKALKGQGVQFINCDTRTNQENPMCVAAQGYPTFASGGTVCDLGFSTVGELQAACDVRLSKP